MAVFVLSLYQIERLGHKCVQELFTYPVLFENPIGIFIRGDEERGCNCGQFSMIISFSCFIKINFDNPCTFHYRIWCADLVATFIILKQFKCRNRFYYFSILFKFNSFIFDGFIAYNNLYYVGSYCQIGWIFIDMQYFFT